MVILGRFPKHFIPESVSGVLVTKGYKNALISYCKREPEDEGSRFR
jgi:hypothetical protein